MQVPIWLEWLIRIVLSAGSISAITLAWHVIKRLNRDESLRGDYPPHRHINGSIIYPKEYEPAAVGKLPGLAN